MKIKLLFMLLPMLFLWACNNEEYETQVEKIGKQKIHLYGVKTVDAQTRGVADGAKRWNQEAGIRIKFINAPADAQLIEKVKLIAAEWKEYAGIEFNYVDVDVKADVRIAFDWNGNDWLTWSYTGTDAKFERSQSQPTAVFGGLQYLDEQEFKGDVLRVFGQILGLEYEQRHQEWFKNGYWKDEAQLQNYWEDQFEGYSMDWDEIREYVFDPLTNSNASQLIQTREIDELSVMAWPYYNRKQTSKLLANYELSAGDKAFIAQLYPKKEVSLPTIQKAWVDAGYFEWTDDTKTALKITNLGKEQEYLPDVSDGEQLTSAFRLFENSSLKKAPKFNTANITNFEYMFMVCESLTNVPELNTSNGNNFKGMFFACKSLSTIPQINTSKGTSFLGMFWRCNSLASIPSLDTSKGTDFRNMFSECNSLVSIPELDTSMGIDFRGMFESCYSLVRIPYLNTSKGTDFSRMFENCKLLVSIPELKTSMGITFTDMFNGCVSLSSIPLLDTSKGTSFTRTFRSCESLSSIPALNTSNGIYFIDMFTFCTSLSSIPSLDTSNGTHFNYMFNICTSLTSIPQLNTSKGIYFEAMFHRCTSLSSIPQLDTSNGIDFSSMFSYCTNLSIKPDLDLSKATNTTNMYDGTPFANK